MSLQVPLLDAAAVSAALPPAQCIQAMHDVLRSLDRGSVVQPLRSVLRLPDGSGALYTMPAFTLEPAALTVKLITIFDSNQGTGIPTHQGVVVVFDPRTGRPALLLDAARLTAIRTASVSAVATEALARADSTVLAILGTGVQARSHAEILPLVRVFREIRIWGRSHDRAQLLAESLRASGANVTACESVPHAVGTADVICTATSARDPVLRGEWLSDGVHINAIGSSTPAACELDSAAVLRARVFVDSAEAARAEAGDLIQTQREGTDAPEWTELGAVLNERADGRRSAADVTLFKSVGLAAEDAAAAAVVIRNTRGAWS